MRLYLDSSAIIYCLEGAPAVRELAVHHIEQAERSPSGAVITSQLSRLECRVKPLRDGRDSRSGHGRLRARQLQLSFGGLRSRGRRVDVRRGR
jgi:hypothetical protein